MLKRLSVVVLVALALACSREGPLLRVSTEGTTFDRSPAAASYESVAVPFSVRNVGDATAWVPACGANVSVVVQRWVDNKWAEYSGTICMTFAPMLPIELRSGQSTAGAFQITDAGRFRFAVSYTPGAGGREGERWSYSNAFDVH